MQCHRHSLVSRLLCCKVDFSEFVTWYLRYFDPDGQARCQISRRRNLTCRLKFAALVYLSRLAAFVRLARSRTSMSSSVRRQCFAHLGMRTTMLKAPQKLTLKAQL
eukprot:153823-Amphidinium_carterae.1